MKGLIFTYVLCYGGAFASLFRPWYGLLIYVCFSIIRPESLWYWSLGGSGGNFSRIIAIALFIGWGVNGFGKWNLGRSRRTVLCFIGFWVWALLSSLIVSTNPEMSLYFVEEQAKALLPFLVGASLIDSEKKLRQLAWVIALSQGYVALDFNVSYFDGFNRLEEIGIGGMDNNCVAIAMVTGTGLAFFLGIFETNWILKLVAFACAALMTHCILFSFSRGGMLGLIITGFATFCLIKKTPQHLLLFALAGIVGLALAGPEVQKEFMSSFEDEENRDYSSQSRVDLWKIGILMAAEHPVFGVGPDQYPFYVDKYQLSHSHYVFHEGKEAHSLWVQMLAEVGFPGLFFLVGFYGFSCLELLKIRKSNKKQPESTYSVSVPNMVIASLVGFAVSAQFVTLEGLELPYFVTLIAVGAIKLHRGFIRNLLMRNMAIHPHCIRPILDSMVSPETADFHTHHEYILRNADSRSRIFHRSG